MVKTLRKRFVAVSMSAVAVMLVFLLGYINITNYHTDMKRTDELLNIVAARQYEPNSGFPPERNNGGGMFGKRITEDAAMGAVYFAADTDVSGNILRTDTSRIASVTDSDVGEYLKLVSEEYGRVGNFKYKVTASPDGKIKKYTFLDISGEINSAYMHLFVSLIAGAFCFGIMFLFVLFISGRAIRPIAENIERQKSFVTDAGHEIKTPLSIILANTEALELHSGTSKWSENIKSQVSRLNGLVQNLLTLAKTDEDRTVISVNFSLSETVYETLGMFSESAVMKNISFKTDIKKEAVCFADKEYISRLISILIDNAVKYSENGGEVEVVLKNDRRFVYLTVSNKTRSLPDCKPEKLFDRFYRGDPSRNQNGGFGIGLSAAKAISRLFGGDIKAEFKDGNTVSFTVKLKSKS